MTTSLNVEGSKMAPVIYADYIGSIGVIDGVATISLEAKRFLLVKDGERADDRIVVTQLRIPLGALDILAEAIRQIKQMAREQTPAGSTITAPGTPAWTEAAPGADAIVVETTA